MFERIFGEKEIGPEEAEEMARKVIEKQLALGINAPNIWNAFKDAKQLNESRNLHLTNNHLLNLTKAAAHELYSPAEVYLYAQGKTELFENIDTEIETLRHSLSSAERRS